VQGRIPSIGALALAMLVVTAPSALAEEGASTDVVRFTTDRPNTSTGVYASEVFNTRDANGQLERLRHSKVEFPPGTVLGQYGAEICTATQQDFQQKGLAACPKGSQIGAGQATITTTGTPVEAPPIALDVTAFNTPGAFLMVFTSHSVYVSQQALHAHDTVEEADITPSCVVPTETDPCPHGEFEPKSLTVYVPPHSRVIDGQVYNVTTTPPTCPPGGWIISDVHTFADGSQDPFSNVNPCRSP
jgi:hypothetical protein